MKFMIFVDSAECADCDEYAGNIIGPVPGDSWVSLTSLIFPGMRWHRWGLITPIAVILGFVTVQRQLLHVGEARHRSPGKRCYFNNIARIANAVHCHS